MADDACTRSVVVTASTGLHQHYDAGHRHHTNAWGTWEELLLASAVQRYGNDSWSLISTELQSRTRSSSTFTPEACQAKYEAIKLRFGFDETREEGGGTLWFEELRKLRVAHLKQELEQYDNSIGSLEKKIRRLQSEKAKSTRDKRLTLGYGAIEPERTPYGTSERCSNVVLVESGSGLRTHSDLAPPVSVHALVQFNNEFVMVQPNVGPLMSHAGFGLTLAKGHNDKADMVQLNVGEAPCLDLSQLNGGVESAVDLQAFKGSKYNKKGDDHVGVLECVVQGAQIVGVCDRKDGITVKVEGNAKGEECNAAETNLGTGMKGVLQAEVDGDINFLIGSQADENECLLSRVAGVPATNQSPSLEWADSIDTKCQHVMAAENVWQYPSTSKNGTATKDVVATQDVSQDSSSRKVKFEKLTVEDFMSEPGIHKLKGGMQTLASGPLAVTTPRPAKLDSKNHCASSTKHSPSHEVWGECLEVGDTQTELARRKERFLAQGKIQQLSLSVTESSDKKRDASVPFTPVESSVKTESITTSNEASDSVHASGSSGGNDAWHHHIERLSGDGRVERSELGSIVDGNEDNSPMSKRNKREPKIAGKLIPLLDSLRTVCAHKCAPLFKHNWESQKNPRYDLMIRVPMDLGMIRIKLEEGQYSGSSDFFRDLLLMASNALIYYSKDSSESAAASGLRECIIREMEFIFEAEVLVKQEGPAFRKRDTGKARQLSPGKPGKVIRAQMLVPSTADMPIKDLALKECDFILNVGCQGHQIDSIRPDEGAKAARVTTDKEDGSSFDAKRFLERDPRMPKGAFSSVPSKKASEPEAWGSVTAMRSALKDSIIKERLAESLSNEEWSSAKARIKATAGTSNKSVESCSDKIATAPQITPVPLKRGVGRPPKHSHNQDLQRAKEANNSPCKRLNR